MKCKIKVCEYEVSALGLCKPHYLQQYKYGRILSEKINFIPRGPNKKPKKPKELCRVAQCSQSQHAGGFCRPHYMKNYFYGVAA